MTDPYSRSNLNSIVFSTDLLKVDDRRSQRFPNPQRINVDWIQALFAQPLSRHFATSECLIGDEAGYESIRHYVFDTLQLPLNSQSWASVYDDEEAAPDLISNRIEPHLRKALWITFEAPPYLIHALNRLGVPFIDFSIHPVRFLPDYFFGMRTNSSALRERIEAFRLPEGLINEFARLSKARTVRVFREPFPPNSAVFFGQVGVDASLIESGRMAGLEDVRRALEALKTGHEHVYYRPHPHLKSGRNLRQLKKMVRAVCGDAWLEQNTYDILGADWSSTIATLSSSVGTEAIYFGKEPRRFLSRNNYFSTQPKSELTYIPVYAAYLDARFWDWLLDGKPLKNSFLPVPYEGAMKFTLNMMWGR